MIISHLRPPQIRSEEWVIQSNQEHSVQVAQLAAKFADDFGLSEFARIAGLLHDKGKEQQAFQTYIKQVSGYDLMMSKQQKVSHAYVGALIAKEIFPVFYPLLSPIIIGHHRGLYDFTEFNAKMQSKIPYDVTIENIASKRMEIPTQLLGEPSNFHHIIRQLFSCLVDADYLDTEAFMNYENSSLRVNSLPLDKLLPRLESYLNKLIRDALPTPLNKLRNTIQQCCLEKSNNSPGFYSLSVPTGGGKTISSLLWAMHHCIKHNKKRIIIAIPYTSIITQTAQVMRDIFGPENVLEHHSSSSTDITKVNTNDALRERLATENWDYPIIVTTNVQLFESIYSHRTSQCRKLHNICNSVLILDEVQVLPIEYLQPILDSLKSYVQIFGISVLFTSASLPAFSSDILEKSFKLSNINKEPPLNGFKGITEIIPGKLNLHKILQRTELHFDNNTSSYDDIANRIGSHSRVLCIVNTRKDALEIFKRLPDDSCNIHLSRMMCSAHLSCVIDNIKKILEQDSITPIRVISTQLIEAGVDIDFPVVYRAQAGLDSILQAAGRCNREGVIKELAPVYIFELEHSPNFGFIKDGINSLKSLKEISDWYSPETMTKYFIQLYSRINTFDKPQIKEKLYNTSPCFESASNEFKLIDDNTRTVIVNYMNSSELIVELKENGVNYKLNKELQRYSVNIREYDFKKLVQNNIIEEAFLGIYFLPDREQYSNKVGLQIESHFLEELLIK